MIRLSGVYCVPWEWWPWVWIHRWRRAGWIRSRGSAPGFWRRSRGRRATDAKCRRVGCPAAPVPRSAAARRSATDGRSRTRRPAGSPLRTDLSVRHLRPINLFELFDLFMSIVFIILINVNYFIIKSNI